MKILILGSKGNLGNELATLYSQEKPVCWSREDLDITDEKQVMEKISSLRPELVFNCAAFNAVDEAESNRNIADTVNGYAPGYIAKACFAAGAALVHFSSGMVFDGQNSEGNDEDDIAHPVNAYGKSKLLGEMEIQENMENFFIIRTSWLFGKPGLSNKNKKNFVDLILEKSSNASIPVVDDEIGRPTYTLDLAQASVGLIEDGKPFGIYHLTNSGACSRYDWAQEIFKIKNTPSNIVLIKGEELKRAAKRPKYELLNNTKFVELRPWAEALKEYLQ